MTDATHDGKAKGWAIALGLAVALLALVDLIALQGEQVASATARLSASDPATIEISRVGEEQRFRRAVGFRGSRKAGPSGIGSNHRAG